MGNKHRYTSDWICFLVGGWVGLKTCLVGWWIDKHDIKIYVKWKNYTWGYVCKIPNDWNCKRPTGSARLFERWEHSYFMSWNIFIFFAVMILCLLQIENQEFGLKPMNCPGHCLMFQHRVRSYRGKFILSEILFHFYHLFVFVGGLRWGLFALFSLELFLTELLRCFWVLWCHGYGNCVHLIIRMSLLFACCCFSILNSGVMGPSYSCHPILNA